ncbi:MAG: hypothetical protein H0V44_08460 [Planctomycetes bacterium]|nr:hypothetical protein [Planctomycetota bacterium]
MQNIAQDTANSVCPVCGMTVDPALQPVIAPVAMDSGDVIVRIGSCGAQHHDVIQRSPERYAVAAESNLVAKFEDG